MVELMLALSILAMLIMAVTQSGASVTRLFSVSVSRVSIEQQLRQSMGRISDELRHASLESFDALGTAPLWSNATGFDRIEGIDAVHGEGQWRSMRLELRLGMGETDDNTDEDGDGLVDERRLVLVRDFGGPDELELTLLRGVPELFPSESPNGLDDNGNGLLDETGFALFVEDGALQILLSKSGLDSDGRLITRSIRSAIILRN